MRLRSRMLALATAVTCLCALPGTALAVGTWERLAGETAYDTMTEIVNYSTLFQRSNVDVVVIATGDGYWDALSASGIAGIHNAPVLITPTDALGSQAKAEIERLNPSKVYVVGGSQSVNDSVVDAIKQLGPQVTRLYGQNAAGTAADVFEAGIGQWGTTAVVASSTGYWDALAAAPYVYAKHAPLFLTGDDGRLSKASVEAINEGKFDTVVIAGGRLSVSEDVEGQLSNFNLVRTEGEDAIETSAIFASWALDNGMDTDRIAVASRSTYHDALTGAALAGRFKLPLVLVDPEGGVSGFDKLRELGAGYDGGYVFGGKLSVSDAVYNYLANGEPLPEPAPEPTPEPDRPEDGFVNDFFSFEVPEALAEQPFRGSTNGLEIDGGDLSLSIYPLEDAFKENEPDLQADGSIELENGTITFYLGEGGKVVASFEHDSGTKLMLRTYSYSDDNQTLTRTLGTQYCKNARALQAATCSMDADSAAPDRIAKEFLSTCALKISA